MMMMQAIEMHTQLVNKYCNESYYKLAIEELKDKYNNINVSQIIMHIIDKIINETKESINKGLLLNVKDAELKDYQRQRIEGIAKSADNYFCQIITTTPFNPLFIGLAYVSGIISTPEDKKNKYISILNNCIKAYTDSLFENNYVNIDLKTNQKRIINPDDVY